VLSRVDGVTSGREIVQLIPLPPERTQRSLLGLLSTGVVAFEGVRPAQKRAPAAAAERPHEAKAAARPAPEALPTAPAAAPPPPPGPPAPVPRPEPADEKTAERRREILEAWDGVKKRTHFEILGLSRSVGEAEVKDAYFRLAKRFHPDVHHGASLGDLRDELEAVFIRLGEAYDVLRDPRKRADYEAYLGRSRPKPAAEAGGGPDSAPEPAAPEPPRDPEEEARLAEDAIRRAAKLVEQEKYWDAIQLLEPAVEAVQGKPRLQARVLLARSYARNPKWAKSAEATLLAATREEPKAVEPWALLGAMYAGKGLRTRATAMYRKVLELKPDHEDAAQYLALHASPPEPPEDEGGDEGGGGLLGRLFRKG
jgi:tetratricopeptide (TPR) repeat protein